MPLKLRKRKGSRNFWVRGTVRGILVEESTGTDRRDLADAWRIRREVQLLDSGGGATGRAPTFLEAGAAYLEVAKDRRFIAPLIARFGARLVTDIRQDEIDRAAAELYPKAAAATKLRQIYTPMRAILHHAGIERRVRGPKGVELPPVSWPTEATARAFVAAADEHIRPLAIFLFATGARLGEALRLDWGQVDLAAARVIFQRTKNGEGRGVPLHPQAVAALANLTQRQGRVFRQPDGEPWHARWRVYVRWRAAVKAAGVPKFMPHGCRHAFAAWGRRQGWDLGALKALGGWKSDAMALRYGHINPDGLAPEIGRLPDIGSAKK